MADIKMTIGGVDLTIPEEQFSQAVEKKELIIEGVDLKVFKKNDFDTFSKNLAKENYDNGKIAGVEMEVKTIRDDMGLSFEGKTVKNLLEAVTSKVKSDSNIEPSKKIQDLENDLTQLRINLEKEQTEKNNFILQVNQKEKSFKIDNFILSSLPKDGLAISNDKVALLLKSDYEFDFNEQNKMIIKQGGEVLKNKITLEPLTFAEIMPDAIKPYIIERRGGGGGGNESGPHIGTLEAFTTEMKISNINEGSQAFNEEMQKRMKVGTLKI